MAKNGERINQSVFISYTSILFSIVSGLLYTPWLIKNLGSSDYALYSITISIMAYFTIDFGIGAAITRFIARYRAEKNEYKINQLLGIALKIYLIIDAVALVALIVVFFFLSNIYSGLTFEELNRLRVVFIITGAMITCCIPVMPINGVFIAYGRVYNVKLFDLIQKALTVGLTCISILIGKGLYLVVFINAFTTVSINILKIITIHKKEKVAPDVKAKDKQITKELLAFSGWVAIAMVADKFFFSFEPTLLGMFSNSTQIAIFAVAASVEGYVLTFADGLNGIFLPRVTNMVVTGKSKDEITDLMIRVGRFQLAIVSCFIIGFVTQGFDFIRIWFGKEYSPAYIAAVVVLSPCIIHLTESIANEYVYATNSVKYRAYAYVISSILNVVITALLAPKMGALGAAIGIATGFLVGHELTLNYFYSKKLGIDIYKFFVSCHIRSIPSFALMFVFGFALSHYIPVVSRGQIICRIIICGLGYILIVYALLLNENEKQYINRFIKQILYKLKASKR